MSKVKLVFVKSYTEVPTWTDTFSKTLDIPSPFDAFHLIGARIFREATRSDTPMEPEVDAVITEFRDYSGLLGRLLTYVDATYADPEQRKAHKDIIKKIVWDFEEELRQRAKQAVDSHNADEEVEQSKKQ